ncbi:hypothetical protein ScPMuIL_017097 [Solemya velum]
MYPHLYKSATSHPVEAVLRNRATDVSSIITEQEEEILPATEGYEIEILRNIPRLSTYMLLVFDNVCVV